MNLNRRDALKLVMAGAGAAMAAPGLASIAGAAPLLQKKQRKVIFVTHDLNLFFVGAIAGLRDFGAMAGWDTNFVGPVPADAQKCIEMQYNAIAAKPDAVGFTAIDSEAFLDPIKKAQDAGIFVVLYNTRAPGVKEKTGCAYVGQDFLVAGNIAGYEVCKYVTMHTGRKDGKIIMSNFQPGHFALETRNLGGSQGIEKYNKDNGTSFTSEALATSSNETDAIAKFEAKWSAEKDNIVGWLSSEFTHTFIGDWAKQNNLVGKFAVGGYDLLDQTLINIKDGSVDFSIGQNPFAQGFLTSALIYQGLEIGYPASDIDTGAELIDSTNIDKVTVREQLWKDKAKEYGVGG
jgi:ABC-type sugar transport system substrate-binding protein